MKKVIKILIVVSVFMCSPLLMNNIFADQPPDPGGGPGGGDEPVGGGSPLGSGLVIMVVMGAAYGTRKIYDARKRLQ